MHLEGEEKYQPPKIALFKEFQLFKSNRLQTEKSANSLGAEGWKEKQADTEKSQSCI